MPDMGELVDMGQDAHVRDTLSGQGVLDILEDIRGGILATREAGFDLPELVLMPKMSIQVGRTKYKGQGIDKFLIGTAELRGNRDAEFELGVAMLPVVGAFHEICGHGGQTLREFRKDRPLSRVLAANYCACRGSPYYYDKCRDGSDEYKQQPHEIAAQYAGIREATSYLTYAYGEAFAKKAILTYQKVRMDSGSALIGTDKEYKDVKEILFDLDKRFHKAVTMHHPYDVSKISDNDKEELWLSRQDAIFSYARRKKNFSCVLRVENGKNGMRQDMQMAFAYLEQEAAIYAEHQETAEEYRKAVGNPVGELPVFASGWLNCSRAFGTVRSRLPEGINKYDARLQQLSSMMMDLDTNTPLIKMGSSRPSVPLQPKKLGAPPDRYGQAVGALGSVVLEDEEQARDGRGTQIGNN